MSFSIARGELLVAYDDETIDNEEFVLLLKQNISRNPSFTILYNVTLNFESRTPD